MERKDKTDETLRTCTLLAKTSLCALKSFFLNVVYFGIFGQQSDLNQYNNSFPSS